MEPVKKSAENPFFKSSYADYPSVIAAVMPALQAYDLVLTIAPGLCAEGVLDVHARISHAPTGQFISTTMGMPLGKEATPQSCGSAVTYASRYLVQALLALPAEDDDGTTGTEQAQKKPSHPHLPEWKRQISACKDEDRLSKWAKDNFTRISQTDHADELNALYMSRLDTLRNT